MKNFIKHLLFIVIICSFNIESFANDTDSEQSYFEDEGKLVFKIRGYGIFSSSDKQKKLLTPTAAAPKKIGQLFDNGYGLDTVTGIFLNEHFAAELSLGVTLLNVRSSVLDDIKYNYGGSSSHKKGTVYMIPLSIIGQYHMAPFGGISPYIGAGYHGAYTFTRAKDYKVGNPHGPVLQVGLDFIGKDDTIFTLDIRNIFANTKVTYKSPLVNNEFSSKIKINSLVVSLGIGFKL